MSCTAILASPSRMVFSGDEGRFTGPTGGSVAVRLPCARSRRNKTSLHQEILSAGSCVGDWILGAASASWERRGMGAVSGGRSVVFVVEEDIDGAGGGGGGGAMDKEEKEDTTWLK